MADQQALLEAVGRGDAQAWSELLEHYRPFVVGRLRQARRARNWFWLDDLDDVAQEVLVRFYEAVRDGKFHYRDEDQLRGYLVRTAFYAVMKRKDHAAAERPVTELLSDDDRERAIRDFDLAGFADNAFDIVGRRECLRELYRAIESLQPSRAEVLRLTLLGLSPAEIAHRQGKTANAVSVQKHHALRDLKAALEAGDFVRNCGHYFLDGGGAERLGER